MTGELFILFLVSALFSAHIELVSPVCRIFFCIYLVQLFDLYMFHIKKKKSVTLSASNLFRFKIQILKCYAFILNYPRFSKVFSLTFFIALIFNN